MRQSSFLRPVLLVVAGAGALPAGVGFLPLLGVRHHLNAVSTGALVSLLAAATAVVEPWAGRHLGRDQPPRWTPSAAAQAADLVASAAFALPARRAQLRPVDAETGK